MPAKYIQRVVNLEPADYRTVKQFATEKGLGDRTARAALVQDPAQSAEALEYVNRLAEAGQVEMRALIFELRPESLQTEGLVVALQKLAQVLETRHNLVVPVDLCPEPDIALELKETLYRIAQEATHNTMKHARATQIRLSLQFEQDRLCLVIVDNGVGFDPSTAYPGHMGLNTMRERAARYSGELHIQSSANAGMKIQLSLPKRP